MTTSETLQTMETQRYYMALGLVETLNSRVSHSICVESREPYDNFDLLLRAIGLGWGLVHGGNELRAHSPYRFGRFTITCKVFNEADAERLFAKLAGSEKEGRGEASD